MPTKARLFDPALARLADQLKALSHPARLSILQILAERASCICGEVVDDLPLAQATVSRHLKVLKEAGLVEGTVEGPRVCYCLNTEAVAALSDHLGGFFDDVLTQAPTSIDC